MSVLILRWF